MTAKMLEALGLLVEHGDGDISHDHPTALNYGTPTISLRTALALDKLGYVHEDKHLLEHSPLFQDKVQPVKTMGFELVEEGQGG